MSVKCFPFVSKILRNNGRVQFAIAYNSEGNILLQKFFHRQVLFSNEFHTTKIKQFKERDEQSETDKKIQLTNFMVSEAQEDGDINGEALDDEFSYKEFQKTEGNVSTNTIRRDELGSLSEQKDCTKNKNPIDEVNNGEDIRAYLNTWIYKKSKERISHYPSNDTLNEELTKLEVSLRPSANDVKQTKHFLYFLQNEINKQYTNCHVTPFGSVINGFWIKNSDIDICIQVPVLLNRKDQIKFLKKICIILNTYKGGIIEQRFSAKVPIIHFSCTNEKNCFELSCDISINNILAIVNSKLIQQYVGVDKRLQVMGIALKYWSKNRNINDRSKGFLSSFSLILMIIHFLQNVADPKILPSLQDIAFERNEKPYYVFGVDCKYCTDEKIIKEKLYKLNNCKDADTDVATLIIQFFKFYGYQYKSGVIAIRDIANYYQNFQVLKDFESYFLFVDNPFEVGKNVANILPQNYKTIINEMKRAYKILKANGTWKEVCHSNDTLSHSY